MAFVWSVLSFMYNASVVIGAVVVAKFAIKTIILVCRMFKRRSHK